MATDGTTNIRTIVYREMVQDQNTGKWKRKIDEIRSERFGYRAFTSAGSAGMASQLCSFATLTSGGVRFHLRSVIAMSTTGDVELYLREDASAGANKFALHVPSGGHTVVNDIRGVYFDRDCRVAFPTTAEVRVTVGGIIELLGGPY